MRSTKFLLPAFGMAVLILDAKIALEGARSGLELCVRTVIPSLFPFIFLSVMITGALVGQSIRLLEPIRKLCRIPKGSEGILAVGLIGGYPIGAQSVAQAYRDGHLSKQDAQRMLGFCSNAGPSFIFGMLSHVFGPPALWTLWGIHIFSALLTGILLPGESRESIRQKEQPSITYASALERSLKAIALICGWVILFRVLIAFLERWFIWLLPKEIGILLSGLLELTNGCSRLMMVESEGLRFVIASVLLAFGGLCVSLQTVSVTKKLGVGMYFSGKAIQTAASAVLSYGAQHFLFPGAKDVPAGVFWFSALSVIAVSGWAIISKIHSSNLARRGV